MTQRISRVSDVVVIGGGIVGSSVAYNAARAGLSVTLVDRADEGYATAAGAGIVAPGVGHHQDTAHNALMAEAGAYYPKLIAQLAEDGEKQTGYDAVGALLVATSEAEADLSARGPTLRAGSPGGRGAGHCRCLHARRPPGTDPLPRSRRCFGRTPYRRHSARRRTIDARGAATGRGTPWRNDPDRQRRAHEDDNGQVHVTVDGQPLPAESVVLAAGAWSASLVQALGVTLPVFPQRGQIAHLDLPETETSRWPVVLPLRGHYLLTFPSNRVVAGATRENDAGFDYRMTAGGVYEVLGQALRVAPGLSRGTLREVRIGFRPATPDGLPILGRIPGFERVYIATGHGPSGLTLGPHAGAVIVDLIRGQSIDLDLTPYAAERFQRASLPAR